MDFTYDSESDEKMFIVPVTSGFTIYTKNECNICVKVKQLLYSKNYRPLIINCDEYLLFDRDEFLSNIKIYSKKEYEMFPMVFFDGSFLGGYQETKDYLDNLLEFD
jgi:glutaredoxin